MFFYNKENNNRSNAGDRENRVKKRVAAGLLAGVLGASMVTGLTACGNNEGTKVVFTTGFGKNEVFRIGDESCSKAEIMIYLTTTQNQYENVYGTEIWNTSLNGVTLEDNVKETVLARIAQIKTMYLLAKEKEVTLDDAEEAKVVQAAQEYYSSLNDTEIETMGATEEIVENLYREYAMADKVYKLIIQDINPEISDDEARKITVQQIFFATASTDMDGNLKPYSESSIQNAYEKACEVRAMAVDGEHDFTELASKYSDDSEITYSFGKGETESAYEEAAFNLATDEVSGVVKCERGYYIIKCINTLDREETDANKLKIVEERKREVFGQEYDSFVDTLVRQLNDKLWDEITLITDEQVTTDSFFDVYAKYFPEE